MTRPARPLRDRVFERLIIDPDTGCLNWTGPLASNGYAQIKSAGHRRRQSVHRLMYEWFVGPIPEGLHIDHLCRNRRCAAPAHLEAVTCRENVLRGVSIQAMNAAKTHCDSGHEFSDANTRVYRERWRVCRACSREATARYRARRAITT